MDDSLRACQSSSRIEVHGEVAWSFLSCGVGRDLKVLPIVLKSVKKSWSESIQCFKEQIAVVLQWRSPRLWTPGFSSSFLQTFWWCWTDPPLCSFRLCSAHWAWHQLWDVRLWINCRSWLRNTNPASLEVPLSLGSDRAFLVGCVICQANSVSGFWGISLRAADLSVPLSLTVSSPVSPYQHFHRLYLPFVSPFVLTLPSQSGLDNGKLREMWS